MTGMSDTFSESEKTLDPAGSVKVSWYLPRPVWQELADARDDGERISDVGRLTVEVGLGQLLAEDPYRRHLVRERRAQRERGDPQRLVRKAYQACVFAEIYFDPLLG